MAAAGINAVRTYTVPPRWLLDRALAHGIRVMVGLPWEQHVTFLDDAARARSIEERVRAAVRACAGHPAVLCYAVGNEIPAPIVRWYGARKVERFLRRLYQVAKEEDVEGIVTYVNYPSTEYLDLDFADLICFNVYLEQQDPLETYLARLQNLAGDRPLLLAEVGLDSRRHGEAAQARVLEWQIRSIFGAGAAGIFVFAWTDEWHRGGHDIEDWDFGLVDRERRPKPALTAVKTAFADVPFPDVLDSRLPAGGWPRISVVVCSLNGARTLPDCCAGLSRLDYPTFEVIVVDDGSTDATPDIAHEYGFQVITTENRGLSAARNTGYEAASGEIIAYTDDDARPDPHWLRYLAMAFLRGPHAGTGGPNIAPPGDGQIADAVANAPGGPVHVLLSDEIAEHIPGCNMAYRKSALEAVGGFDPRYRAAGDDVDMCWRLQERGWTVGFSPGAMVWHHRRNSVKAYWKQQRGYGKAEALLEEKWPERFNPAGHITWSGRLYGKGLTLPVPWGKSRIYSGVWGSAPFQSVYGPNEGTASAVPLMPEWYLLVAALAVLTVVGILWLPLLIGAGVLLLLSLAAPVIQAARSTRRASFTSEPQSVAARWRLLVLTATLHLLQPAARLWGRLRHGLTLWRRRAGTRPGLPAPRTLSVWSEEWRSPEAWLAGIQVSLRAGGCLVRPGGAFDRWDLHVRGGALGAARVRLAVEEHGGGKQLARFRIWPRVGTAAILLSAPCALSALGAGLSAAWAACATLAVLAAAVLAICGWEAGAASAAIWSTVEDKREQ
jgi:GT2 family glycosyltransferase